MREISFIEATREVLAEAMARDPSIFVVGEGIGADSRTDVAATAADCVAVRASGNSARRSCEQRNTVPLDSL